MSGGIAPFEERPNRDATVRDLDICLMRRFASYSGRDGLKGMADSHEGMAESLGILRDGRPTNAGLLFFNDRPDDFVRCARIEIVWKSDPTGRRMAEHTIRGPLDRQLTAALAVIQNYYVMTFGDGGWCNYPMDAVAEALSNAVIHKDYGIPEPVTVTILPDRMEITSLPGPASEVPDGDVSAGRLGSGTGRVWESMKVLGLTPGDGGGIRRMAEAMRANGSEPPEFLTDRMRTHLTVMLLARGPANPEIQKNVRTGRRTSGEISAEVVGLLTDGREMSIRQIAEAMGYRSPPSSLRNVVGV